MTVLAIALGLAELIWTPAQQWLDRAPLDVGTIKDMLSPLTHFVTHVQDLRSSAQSIDRAVAPAVAIPSTVVEASSATLFETTRAAAISTLAFIVVTLILLVGGPPMLANMAAALTSDLKSAHIIDVIERLRNRRRHGAVMQGGCRAGLSWRSCGEVSEPPPPLSSTFLAKLRRL